MRHKGQGQIETDRRRREKWKLLKTESKSSALNGLGFLTIRTQSEVALIMGITRQAVQQLERMAFFKIRERISDEFKPWM